MYIGVSVTDIRLTSENPDKYKAWSCTVPLRGCIREVTYHNTAHDAALAYDAKVIKYRLENTLKLNFS